MTIKWKTGLNDIKLLKELTYAERGRVAEQNRLTITALNQLIHRIKKRFRRYEWYVSEVRKILASYPEISKMFESAPEYNPEEEEKE